MKEPYTRQAIDLSAYPDLVVIHLGMRAKNLRGFVNLMKFGPRKIQAVAAKPNPNGLLLSENLIYSLHESWLGISIRCSRYNMGCANTGATLNP